MRFMVMHKVDSRMEAGERPPQSLIQEMGALIGRSLKSGIFKDGAGLHRSATRARVTFQGGKPSVERGPYSGSNELIASFALITTDGIDKAIELAIELAEAAGGQEVEIGPVVEGWDLTGKARPADAPYRFLLLVKADASFEAGAPQPAAVRGLLDQWKRDGIMQSDTLLKPSKSGARGKTAAGQLHWVDGPFAESKELIAGFSILELPSLDEVKRFSEEYAAILGDTELDIREVA